MDRNEPAIESGMNDHTRQKENVMKIENKTILITGASRGIGRALVDEALRRGAKKVYAGTRGAFEITDERDTRNLGRDRHLAGSAGC